MWPNLLYVKVCYPLSCLLWILLYFTQSLLATTVKYQGSAHASFTEHWVVPTAAALRCAHEVCGGAFLCAVVAGRHVFLKVFVVLVFLWWFAYDEPPQCIPNVYALASIWIAFQTHPRKIFVAATTSPTCSVGKLSLKLNDISKVEGSIWWNLFRAWDKYHHMLAIHTSSHSHSKQMLNTLTWHNMPHILVCRQ